MINEKDYYSKAVDALFSVETFVGTIWVPCWGKGNMIDNVKRNYGFNQVIGSTSQKKEELIRQGCSEAPDDSLLKSKSVRTPQNNAVYVEHDFLSVKKTMSKNIITKLPIELDLDIVKHALSLDNILKTTVLLNTEWLTGAKRYDEIFAEKPPTRVWVLNDKLPKVKENLAWFVWDLSSNIVSPPVLGWVNTEDLR